MQMEKKHPGIRIDQIRPSGIPGLLFVVATVILFAALPPVRAFLLVSLPLGVLGALVRIWWLNRT